MKRLLSALFALSLGNAALAAIPAYLADPATSHLEFTGVQAGADFKGAFHKFTAAVDFAPDALPTSRIDVQIDMSSEDSKDKSRDDTIRGADIFDAAHFPTAHYLAKGLTKTATGYSAIGRLTMRGVSRDIPIEFQLTTTGSDAKLEGAATLKRLDFGVGQGDWKSTDQIADLVKVHFSLVLKPKS